MTMVAGYHSAQGVVLISDSRATWGSETAANFQDSLQKIVPLADGLVLAYAGDVRAAERIIRELRGRIAKRPALRIARKLAAEAPRIAKHFYSIHHLKLDGGVSLMIAGREAGGHTGLWVLQSPNFVANRISDGLAIMGSGMVAGPLLKDSMPPVSVNPSLKERADSLMLGLESALRKKGVPTVGGMFQVLAISPADGIRPLTHGHVDVDPDSPPSAKRMTISAGKWTQEDLATGARTHLVEPALLTNPELKRTVDYELDENKRPKWHVVRFLVCMGFGVQGDRSIFKGPTTIISSEQYPLEGEVLVVTGFWGTAGDHDFRLELKKGGQETILDSRRFNNLYLPEDIEMVSRVRLKVDEPGPAFLEAWIDDQLLARRAIRFAQLDEPIPNDPSALATFAAKQDARLKALQREDHDPDIEGDLRPGVAYFALCQNVRQDRDLEFENEFKAAYWKEYPLLLRCNIALAFRAAPGEHKLKLALVDAATRAETLIDTGTCVSTSNCLTTTFAGEVVIKVPKPGIYFVNALLDDRRLATRLLFAETAKGQWSYGIRDQDSSRVEAGELLLLALRSQIAPK